MKRTPKQHEAYLRTEPAFQAFYAQYDPKSIEEFIKDYARQKLNVCQSEFLYKAQYDSYHTQFLRLADDYIDMILQKKLFNLQCQWRAGLVELPLVDFIGDFDYWSNHIRACPFLPLITAAEIDLCTRFLKEGIDWSQNNYAEKVWQEYDHFQNYFFIQSQEDKEAAKKSVYYDYADLPSLYSFFDEHQGTGDLVHLPNIRGEKEADYRHEGFMIGYNQRVAETKTADATEEEEADETENVTDTTAVLDTKESPETKVYLPNLYGFGGESQVFVDAVEDAHTQEMFKYYRHYKQRDNDYNYEGLEDDLAFLQEFNEPIKIEAFDDWRTAIMVATYRFKQNKAAEMLPYAYDTYLLEFEDEDEETILLKRLAKHRFDPNQRAYKILSYHKEEFLDGREALTGKRDFDYLND
jgi:hypothetical protein